MTNSEARRTAEYIALHVSLRNLWEGCVEWKDAIRMVGANDCPAVKKLLRGAWNKWNRNHNID